MRFSSLTPFLCLFLFDFTSAASCPYAGALKTKRAAPQVATHVLPRSDPAPGKKGVFFHNRISPGVSQLYIANADGSDARLLLSNNTVYEYDAQWSPDAEWIVFTSERNGDGNSDVWRVRPDGSGLEEVAATPAVETAGSISPNGSLIAYSGTLNNWKSNIWIKDLTTGANYNITNTTEVAGNSSLPDGHFRPAWSPDGEWIVFSSDKDTLWRGHNDTKGWEHTQETSIYTMRVDGTGYRKVANSTGYSLGSPKFSPDGSRVIFYQMSVENTFQARIFFHADFVTNQIASANFATGGDWITHTDWSGIKIFPQYIDNNTIAYLRKGSGEAGSIQGLNYTAATPSGTITDGYSYLNGSFRSPSWSPNGTLVIYQVQTLDPIRPLEKVLYSWDDNWEYRFIDVFPKMSYQGVVAYTNQQTGDASASVYTMLPSGANNSFVFEDLSNTTIVPYVETVDGDFDAMQAAWTSDGKYIASGWGNTFQGHDVGPSDVVIYPSNATGYEYTIVSNQSVLNSGFPSFSPNNELLVYREFGLGGPLGLRILNLTDGSTQVLTMGWDNTPAWSPDGTLIVFTRRTSIPNGNVYQDNYDVCTIHPDGSNLTNLTPLSLANDAHAIFTNEGQVMYSTGEFGFQDEGSLYDDNFQPYAQIVVMNADGTNKTAMTNGLWEDAMPLFVSNEFWS
ncbi:uncharacterized protein PAC_17584 [Phialocephala subalpina]|uniref:Uncharacterized protein n=1 Tax=Phialocephala subalpina TaxID=576137 RepID=A0A1L7XRQ1_9HELO|nr:uncharacterized protein PAC_17584 [Phialocephala subalpina]